MFHFRKKNILSDIELIASFRQSGDNAMVGELFKRYSHLVFGVCMKYLKDDEESKDAVMMIFEKLLTDLNKYDIENFKSWLHVTAKNHCLMKLRAEKSMNLKTEEMKNTSSGFMESVYVMHHDDESKKEVYLDHIENAIEQLNDEQKACIDLFYLKGKCYKEVAETTGYSLNQVKSYIQNGKRNMKIYMENRYEQQAK